MNFRSIRFILSRLFIVQSITFVLPLIVSLIYKESITYWLPFLAMAVIVIALGFLIGIKTDKSIELGVKDGLIGVALCWIMLSLLGSIPYVLANVLPDIVDAIFETTSGFTTTGGSVITDLSVVPHSYLFYRALTQWVGGIGILVFMLTIITEKNEKNSIHLLRAESTGYDVGKMTSKMKMTTRILVLIYVVLTLIEIILLALDPGMDIFSAICLSFSTTATGGFSVLGSGITDYSRYVQYVITVIMLLSGINFTAYYLIMIGKIKQVLKNEEIRWYFIIILISIGLIVTNIIVHANTLYTTFEEVFRHSAFTVVSLITTTGFGTTNFIAWPEFSKIILLIIMIIGSCAGSTAGGMKVSRMIILSKSAFNKASSKTSPDEVKITKLNGDVISRTTVVDVHSFALIYMIVIFLGTLILSLDFIEGYTILDYFTASITSISNVGPGLTNAIGPYGNFASFSWLSKLVMSFEMLVGRLELFPMFALFDKKSYHKF